MTKKNTGKQIWFTFYWKEKIIQNYEFKVSHSTEKKRYNSKLWIQSWCMLNETCLNFVVRIEKIENESYTSTK